MPHLARTIAWLLAVGSPPSRLARLGYTTLARPTLPIPPPMPPELKPNSLPHMAPSHPTEPDLDVEAAATHLSDTLLSYGYRDWELYATQLADNSNLAALSLSHPPFVITLPPITDIIPQTYLILPL